MRDPLYRVDTIFRPFLDEFHGYMINATIKSFWNYGYLFILTRVSLECSRRGVNVWSVEDGVRGLSKWKVAT